MGNNHRTMPFKIFRFDPEKDSEPRYRTYEVPLSMGMTVLDGLYYILENHDGSLAFRSSCRAAVCGSCAMKINGHFGLACRTLVEDLKSMPVTVEPLAHLPVVKDLVVDMTRFYEKYAYIEPLLVPKEVDSGKEFLQSPEDRRKLDGLLECILCGACYAGCTMVRWDPNFPGPSALLWADAKLRDSRDREGRERIIKLIDESGIWRCHAEIRCTDVCPKNLSPTEAIDNLKRESVLYRFLSPRRKKRKGEVSEQAPAGPLPEPPSQRRTFLKTVFLGGATLLTALFLSLFSVPLLSRPKRDLVPGWIESGTLPEIEMGKPFQVIYTIRRWEKGSIVSYPRRAYIVKRGSGELMAIDPTCTHLGCTCYWDESIKMFLCPCHGGAFDFEGNVTLGPPPGPLARLEVKVEAGMLYLQQRI